MTDEQKNKDDAKAKESQEEKAPPKKSGLVKYILFGVAGINMAVSPKTAAELFQGRQHATIAFAEYLRRGQAHRAQVRNHPDVNTKFVISFNHKTITLPESIIIV